MNRHITKAELLAMIRAARARWEALLAEIPPEWLTELGVTGEWSVKDVIAHISWGERENIGVVRAHAVVGSELWQLAEDERNAAVFAQNRSRSLEDVLSESEQVFQEYLAGVESLSEEELNDPSGFPGIPSGWRPWRILYDPTHYEEHGRAIQTWLAKRRERKG
jgi:DinB superfamily